MFTLICAWINGWVNSRDAGDLRRHRVHYGVIVMLFPSVRAYVTIIISSVFSVQDEKLECFPH